MSIDVAVVTYNNADTIGPLAASVERWLPGSEVLVCDNSPDERTLTALAALPVTVVASGRNLGFGSGCNLLAKSSSADWLLFLNPDATILRFDLDVEDLPRMGLLGPIIRNTSGEAQRTHGPERTLTAEALARLARRQPRVDLEPSERVERGFVSGAAMLIRRRDFERLGGFDDSTYFMYYEDHDLCRAVRAAGGHVYVDPRFEVEHLGGHSARQAHLEALIRSNDSATAYHAKKGRAASIAFRTVALTETLVKTIVSLPTGRVGQVDRRTLTQLARHQLSGKRPQPLRPTARPSD